MTLRVDPHRREQRMQFFPHLYQQTQRSSSSLHHFPILPFLFHLTAVPGLFSDITATVFAAGLCGAMQPWFRDCSDRSCWDPREHSLPSLPTEEASTAEFRVGNGSQIHLA